MPVCCGPRDLHLPRPPEIRQTTGYAHISDDQPLISRHSHSLLKFHAIVRHSTGLFARSGILYSSTPLVCLIFGRAGCDGIGQRRPKTRDKGSEKFGGTNKLTASGAIRNCLRYRWKFPRDGQQVSAGRMAPNVLPRTAPQEGRTASACTAAAQRASTKKHVLVSAGRSIHRLELTRPYIILQGSDAQENEHVKRKRVDGARSLDAYVDAVFRIDLRVSMTGDTPEPSHVRMYCCLRTDAGRTAYSLRLMGLVVH